MSERRQNRQGRQRNRNEVDHHESDYEMMDLDAPTHEESNHQVTNAGNNYRELDPFEAFMEATNAVDELGNFRQRTRSASSTDLMLMGEETMHALEREAGEEIAIATKILNETHEQVTTGAARTDQQATSSSSVSRPRTNQSVTSREDNRNARNYSNDLEHQSHSITTTPLGPQPQHVIRINRSENVQKKTRAVREPRSSNSASTRKVDPLSYLPYTITVTRLSPEPQRRQCSSTNPGHQKSTSSQIPQNIQRSPAMQPQALQSRNQIIGTHRGVPAQSINQASPLAHPYYPYIPPVLQHPPPPVHVPAILLKPPFDPPNHLMPMDEQWKMYHHFQLKQMDSQFYQELYQNNKELYERHKKLRRELLEQQKQEKQQESQQRSEKCASNHEQQARDVSNPERDGPGHSSQIPQKGPSDTPAGQDQMEEGNHKEDIHYDMNNDKVQD